VAEIEAPALSPAASLPVARQEVVRDRTLPAKAPTGPKKTNDIDSNQCA